MKEISNLSIERKECERCGAIWMNGEHYWSGTGKKGNELDLAGLVCNSIKAPECINPSLGKNGGDTWEKRLTDLNNDHPFNHQSTIK